MRQYLLSVVQPDGAPPPPHVLEPIARNVRAFNDELKAAGVWVFAGGLSPASTATVVRPSEGEMLVIDGPFALQVEKGVPHRRRREASKPVLGAERLQYFPDGAALRAAHEL